MRCGSAGIGVGAYGAVTFSALSGLLLHYLLPYRAEAGPASTQTRIESKA